MIIFWSPFLDERKLRCRRRLIQLCHLISDTREVEGQIAKLLIDPREAERIGVGPDDRTLND